MPRSVHSSGFKIVIRSPVLVQDFVKKDISVIFESQEDVLEIIVVFEANEPIINNIKNIQRY